MKRLLVLSHFCPETPHRTGGVEQVLPPLLQGLGRYGWDVRSMHHGHCFARRSHSIWPDGDDLEPNMADEEALRKAAREFRSITPTVDVVMSVDRALPCRVGTPAVLMINTLSYGLEAVALLSGGWDRVLTPSRFLGSAVSNLLPDTRLDCVGYGVSKETLSAARASSLPEWNDKPRIIKLPHRPDPRKGQAQAVQGLSEGLPHSRDVYLEITWFNEEPQSLAFRQRLNRLAAATMVSQQILWRKWLSPSEYRRSLLACCGVLQVGSFRESFGLSVVEAALFGRPAVTTPQPAIRGVLGKTPLHIEVGDPTLWFKALSRYYSHPINYGDLKGLQDRLERVLSMERMVMKYDRALTAAATAL